MKNTLILQVLELLKHNKISIDKEELAFQIQSHPSYPSLHAITGVLSHFDIDNLALHIPVDIGTLKQLPKSFLAQIKGTSGEEFVVVQKSELHCTILTSDKKKQKLTNTAFLEKFTGIIVAVEKDALLESKQSSKNNSSKILVGLSAILFVAFIATATIAIPFLLYFILSAVGVFISISIIQQEQGNQTVLGSAFCSNATEKKDCDAILNSKGALLFNLFKMSDLGFVYFIGLAVSWLFLVLQNSNINTLYIMSLIALPITVYSIYYQIAVKKWCLLCLGIVGILWAQAAIVLVSTTTVAAFSFTTKTLLITGFGFLITATFWNYIAPNFKSLKNLKQTKIEYFKFKRNFDLFNSLLEKSKTIDTAVDAEEIVFGNFNSKLQITIVTNPFCGHCKLVHILVEDILRKHPKEVKIYIRFNANIENPESELVKITSKLLEIYKTNSLTCLDAMHDIYSEMTSKNWFKKWGNCTENNPYLRTLKKESEWCVSNAINFTPEILINGKSYPKEYDRSDLIYFIEDLAAISSSKKEESEIYFEKV